MYHISSFLLILVALGFSFTACDQDPNSPEGMNRQHSVPQPKHVPDVPPSHPAPAVAKSSLNKTDHTTSLQNASSASESAENERNYELLVAQEIRVHCAYDGQYEFSIYGTGHLVITPSGQMHININGSDFIALSGEWSGAAPTGEGIFISNLGSDGSSGQDKKIARIKMTSHQGAAVWYFSLYLRFVEGEPEIYITEVTCEE